MQCYYVYVPTILQSTINMSVTVAEEGNRRVGEMTDDEVRQCVGGKFICNAE